MCFRHLNETQYKTYARQYSRAKAGGMRGIFSWASGAGLIGVVKDIAKGYIIDYSKRKTAAICIAISSYIISPALLSIYQRFENCKYLKTDSR